MNAIEPVLVVHAKVFGLEASEGFRIDLLSELLLRHQFDPLTAAADVQRGLVRVESESRALRVYRAAGDRDHVAAGEFRKQLHMLGNIAFGSVGYVSVAMHVFGCDRTNPHWEMGIARRQHERVQPVWHQVSQQTGAILIIFAPAMKM